MEKLIIFNEWWETKEISSEKAKDYKRKIFAKVLEDFYNYRQILILNGLRRIGKSTIIFQIIKELLKQENPKNILYFSYDVPDKEPLSILEEYSKITKVNWKKEKIYIFFDEIQKLKSWSSKIKILYDNFPNIKIMLTGSASLMLEKESVKDLAGRYFSINITPLTLREYAELYYEKEINNYEIYEQELKIIFDDYINKPFPELVKWNDKTKIKQYIKELVIDKIIKSDIPESFEKVNISLLSALTEIFMKDVGMILDSTSLSKDLGIHKLTLESHLNYLEFGNLISIIKNFRPSIRSESRKLKKIYPFNFSLPFSYYFEVPKGKIYENLVCNALQLNRYWRKNGKEIDFLNTDGKLLPIEVKCKEEIKKDDLKHITYFLEKFKIKKGAVIYSGKEELLTIQKFRGNNRLNIEIKLVPITKIMYDFQL